MNQEYVSPSGLTIKNVPMDDVEKPVLTIFCRGPASWFPYNVPLEIPLVYPVGNCVSQKQKIKGSELWSVLPYFHNALGYRPL